MAARISATILLFVLRLLTLAAITAHLALAQASVSGLVTDPQGKAVAGATIRVTSPGGQDAEEQTDDSGRFVINSLAAGVCLVSASAPGFALVTKSA
jgi:hypothetical protein